MSVTTPSPQPATAPVAGLPRVQLALNVSDIDAAVEFYGRMFGAEPAKRRPGYANFALTEPPLKLVLIEAPQAAGTLNHLGVELASSADVVEAQGRLAEAGLAPKPELDVTCCYARQDKVWATDPDGLGWEHYTVLADATVMQQPTAEALPLTENGRTIDIDAAVCCS